MMGVAYMTCRDHRLEELTSSGWEFVEALEEDVAEQSCIPITTAEYTDRDGIWHPEMVQSVPTTIALRTHAYLLKRPMDHPVAKLEKRIAEIGVSLSEAEQARDEAVKAAKAHEVSVARLTHDLEDKCVSVNAYHKESAEIRGRFRLMQDDFSKVRERFGSKAVDEAIGRE